MDDKEALENQKLKLEIKKLSMPWYKSMDFWKVLIPTVAVLFSLYYTVGRGLIDSERAALEAKRENLRLEILRFEAERNALQAKIDTSKSKIKELSISRETLLIQVERLSQSHKLTVEEIANIRKKVAEEKENMIRLLSRTRADLALCEADNKMLRSNSGFVLRPRPFEKQVEDTDYGDEIDEIMDKLKNNKFMAR